MQARIFHAAVAFALVASPSTAFAWTEAQVDGVGATVEVASDGSAQVDLGLSIKVQRGWLSALELRGLPPNLELLNPWLTLRGEDRETYRPAVSVDPEGTLELAFERRGAPRRGQYRTVVRYRAILPEAQTRPLGNEWVRVSWTLPAWETGLNNIEVRVILPKGSRPVKDDAAPSTTVTQSESPNQTTLTWKRVQLPRLSPWTVQFDVPAGSWTPATRREQVADPHAELPMTIGAAPTMTAVAVEQLHTWLLSTLLALLCLLKRRSCPRTSLVPTSMWVSIVLLGVLTLITNPPWLWLGWIGMVAMSLKKTRRHSAAPRLGQWHPVQPLRFGHVRTRARDLLDATTVPGLATMVAVTAIVGSIPGHSLASLGFFMPIFFCGTRFHDGIAAESRHRRLLQFMGTVRVPSWLAPLSFEPVACLAGDGQWIDARIRILTERWIKGVQRVDLAVADERAGLTERPVIGLLVVVRAASCADDLIRSRLRNVEPTHVSRTRAAFLLPWEDATLRVLHELVQPIAVEENRDSGTWLLEHTRTTQATRSAA